MRALACGLRPNGFVIVFTEVERRHTGVESCGQEQKGSGQAVPKDLRCARHVCAAQYRPCGSAMPQALVIVIAPLSG